MDDTADDPRADQGSAQEDTMITHRTNCLRFRGLSRTLLLSLVLTLAFIGCGQSDEPETVVAPGASNTSFGMAPPSLDELQAAVNLSAGQTQNVQSALTRWHEAYQERASFQRRSRTADGEPRQGEGPGWGRGRGPLFMMFLADCAGSLTDEQFARMMNFLAERRDRHLADRALDRKRDQVRDGDGSGWKHLRRGDRFGERLGLDEETHAAVREAMRTAHQALRTVRQEYRAGEVNASQVRDRAAEAVNALGTALRNALTEEQYGAFETRMSERTQRVAERRLEHLEGAGEHRIEMLTRLLGLREDQVAALQSARADLHARRTALLECVGDGQVAFADALVEQLQIHESWLGSLQAVLDASQLERMEQLRRLHRRGPGGLRGFPIYL